MRYSTFGVRLRSKKNLRSKNTPEQKKSSTAAFRIEPPTGDGIRHLAPVGRFNELWEAYNRGKRSMTLDLKHPEAKEVCSVRSWSKDNVL